MTMKALSVLALIVLSGLVNFTYAADPAEGSFEKETKSFFSACKTSPCQAPYSIDLIYNHQDSKNARISNDLKLQLSQVAQDQTGVWGDTILEGDYEADGNTRLDSVEVMYKNNQAFGYKITYSEKGWFTGDCQYDGEHKTTLKGCAAGRIVESSYVTLDFKDYFFDENSFADFHAGE